MSRFRAVPLRQVRDLQKEHLAGGVAGARPKGRRPVVAVDLGYDPTRQTTGVFFTGGPVRLNLRFGDAIRRVAEVYARSTSPRRPLLVLEAPLGSLHAADGCPALRTPPEADAHAWFTGAGAVTALAALEFLRVLDRRLGTRYPHRVDLVEAFLPSSIAARKVGQKTLVHWKVARQMHDEFASADAHHDAAWKPLSSHVRRAPVILAWG